MTFRVFALLCWAVLGVSETLSRENSITLATSEYPPYYGEKLANHGPVTEIIKAAYSQVGYDVSVAFYPWPRAELMAQKGLHDGIFPPWYSEQRAQYLAFSDPLFPNNLSFYKRKDRRIAYTSYQDLKPYRIGVVRGYLNPKGFNEAGLEVEEVPVDHHNLLKLALGRLDLVLIDDHVAKYLIKTEMPEQGYLLEKLGPTLESKMQFLCLSKQVPGYEKKLADFNRGLKLLRESGEYTQILSKHGF